MIVSMNLSIVWIYGKKNYAFPEKEEFSTFSRHFPSCCEQFVHCEDFFFTGFYKENLKSVWKTEDFQKQCGK